MSYLYICMKKVYLGSIYSFKQVWLNKIESCYLEVFLFFFHEYLFFSCFYVMILKFVNGFSKGAFMIYQAIYIYIYVYIYIYIYVCVCVCLYLYIYIYIHINWRLTDFHSKNVFNFVQKYANICNFCLYSCIYWPISADRRLLNFSSECINDKIWLVVKDLKDQNIKII